MDFKYGVDGVDDPLVFTGGFVQKNLNACKTIYIEREIGQRPVLAFGNSGSDTSMMNYALINNRYPAEAYMVVADDDEREWGTQDFAAKSLDYAAQGYVSISMKNDFAQIYPSRSARPRRSIRPPSRKASTTPKPSPPGIPKAHRSARLWILCPPAQTKQAPTTSRRQTASPPLT